MGRERQLWEVVALLIVVAVLGRNRGLTIGVQLGLHMPELLLLGRRGLEYVITVERQVTCLMFARGQRFSYASSVDSQVTLLERVLKVRQWGKLFRL